MNLWKWCKMNAHLFMYNFHKWSAWFAVCVPLLWNQKRWLTSLRQVWKISPIISPLKKFWSAYLLLQFHLWHQTRPREQRRWSLMGVWRVQFTWLKSFLLTILTWEVLQVICFLFYYTRSYSLKICEINFTLMITESLCSVQCINM